MDVAGKTYRVSGYEASDGGANTNFSLSIDSTVFGAGSPIPHTRWIQYSTTFVGTGSDTLSIASSVTDGFVAFDNFKVTAVPEPDAWALMIVGLGLTGAAIRIARRGRTNVVGAV